MKNSQPKWEIITAFLKAYGFIMLSDEIYGGVGSTYSYGPLGTKIKNEIRKIWWEYFVQKKPFIHGLESSILTLPQTLKSSQHLSHFIDYVYQCSSCQQEWKKGQSPKAKVIQCPHCQHHQSTNITTKQYNLLFQTAKGSEQTKKKTIYLRPETAQGIFVNFLNVQRSLKLKLPFGIAQIGKVFRNEFTTQYGNFRTCEFELMEIEFFFGNDQKKTEWLKFWEHEIKYFLEKKLFLNQANLRTVVQNEQKRAHYSSYTLDIEYHFAFGWKEIWGLADRSNFDLKQHQQASQTKLTIPDHNNKPVLPWVIEPSTGTERLMLAMIHEHLTWHNNKFTLNLPFRFCYYQVAVLPLTEKLTKASQVIVHLLQNEYVVHLDDKKTVGKRYLFHDAIGTFFCITFDFQSLKDHQVTVRNRTTKRQKRIKITDLNQYLQNELKTK